MEREFLEWQREQQQQEQQQPGAPGQGDLQMRTNGRLYEGFRFTDRSIIRGGLLVLQAAQTELGGIYGFCLASGGLASCFAQ